MKRWLIAMMLMAPLAAGATTTWSYPKALTSKLVESTGTGSAPTLATDGFPLGQLQANNGLAVVYESTGTAFTACSLQAYVYLPESAVSTHWIRVPALDLSVQALVAQAFQGLSVVSPRNRVAWVPSGCAQPGIVWITGTAVK